MLQDIQLAFRLWRRSPASTAIALLSIALSVGATAVVFAAVKAVLLDPLPYTRAERLVQLGDQYPKMREQSLGDWLFWNDTQEIIRRTRAFESVGVYRNAILDLAGGGGATPEALYGLRVTAGLFPTLGVSPILGRNILPGEDQPGHSDEMILSYGLWKRRFQSDRSVVGRTVTVNGHQSLVIGVMPPEFNFPMRREAAHTPSPYVEFWAPLSQKPSASDTFSAVARLRPGVSLAEARQDLASISAALTREFPATNRDRTLRLNLVPDRVMGNARSALELLMCAAVLFMLIGCANVANLLLARGLARQREVTVRLAIGASRRRIARQLLTESCALAVSGGLGGYALTAAAWKILPAIAPVSIPRLAAARADTAIFGFAIAIAVINGILFGMAPALRLAGWRRNIAWHGFGARGAATGARDRVRSSLVSAEVALSVLLLVTGGEALAGFARLISRDPGFQADQVLAAVVLPARERYPDHQQRGLFYQRMLDAVRSIPGVESAGTVDALPFSGENHGGYVSSAGAADAQPIGAEIDVAGGEYLQTMGIHLLEGRWFREEEMKPSATAAIVNTYIARRLWPNQSALGKRICVYCTPEKPDNWKQVIGVVSSARHRALDEPEGGNVYLAADAMDKGQFLAVRTTRPTGEIENAIRRAIAGIDPNQPVFLSAPIRDLIADSVAGRRFVMMLLAITACLALAMSAAGVYGVLSYTVSRRTQEIGVRISVGAAPRDIFALIFGQGFFTVVIGLTAGLAAAWAAMRTLGSVLPGLETGHLFAVPAAAGLVSVTAAIACWIPARRATRTDPIAALREE